MVRFVLARIASSLVLLVVVSFVLFSFIYLAPGNPTAVLTGGHPVPPDQLAALRAHYHLDDPFLAQFGYWFADVLHGDFGPSIASQAPVSDVIGPRIVPTLELALYASLLVLCSGSAAGSWPRCGAAGRATSSSRGTMLIGASIAQYVVGDRPDRRLLVAPRLVPGVRLGSGVRGRIDHLTLPAIALALSLCAFVGRITRAAMIDSLELEHVETARSRGFGSRSVILRHALRSALVPVVTVGGLAIGYLITGAVDRGVHVRAERSRLDADQRDPGQGLRGRPGDRAAVHRGRSCWPTWSPTSLYVVHRPAGAARRAGSGPVSVAYDAARARPFLGRARVPLGLRRAGAIVSLAFIALLVADRPAGPADRAARPERDQPAGELRRPGAPATCSAPTPRAATSSAG